MPTPENWGINPDDYCAPHELQLDQFKIGVANTVHMTAPRLHEATRIPVPYDDLNIELVQRQKLGNVSIAKQRGFEVTLSEHGTESDETSLLVARLMPANTGAPLTINGEDYRGAIAENIALGAVRFAIGALRSNTPLNTSNRASQNAKTRALQEGMVACMRDAMSLEAVVSCYVNGVADKVSDKSPVTTDTLNNLYRDYTRVMREGSSHGHIPVIFRRHSMADNVFIELGAGKVGRAEYDEELIVVSGRKRLTAINFHAQIGEVSADGSGVKLESMLSVDRHGAPLLRTFQHKSGGLEVTAGSPVRSEVAEFQRFLAPQVFR